MNLCKFLKIEFFCFKLKEYMSAVDCIIGSAKVVCEKIAEIVCCKRKLSWDDEDSGDDQDYTDGRNTLSTGGRPPSECRAPIRHRLNTDSWMNPNQSE